jgi:hypothetical protein
MEGEYPAGGLGCAAGKVGLVATQLVYRAAIIIGEGRGAVDTPEKGGPVYGGIVLFASRQQEQGGKQVAELSHGGCFGE